MTDFSVRSDSVNVEQIMEQIRARIREKRGVDYTEQQVRELAAVKLEKFLDPRGVRSDLLDQFRRRQAEQAPPAPPNYAFEEQTLYESHRAPLRWVRRLLQPLLKLFFNPNPLIQALHIQAQLNTANAERETARRGLDQLQYEVLHNLVIETTRIGIDVKNLKMRVESLASRLEFNERRARALESVVVYKPADEDRREATPPAPVAEPGTREAAKVTGGAAQVGATAPQGPPTAGPPATEGPGQRSRRRRRRRGRRSGGSAAGILGAPGGGAGPSSGADPGLDESLGTPEIDEGAEPGGTPGKDVDRRNARPEAVDQTFGIESNPAELPSSDLAPSGPSSDSGHGGPDEDQ